MKRLNKKGFTLIELLAVIVILAVVLVVTVPSVINAMNSARQNAYEEALTIIERYVNGEYEKCKYDLSELTQYNEDIFDDECNLITAEAYPEDADAVEEVSNIILEVTGYDKNKFLTYDARMMASEEIEKTVKELNRELDTQILKEQKKSDQILKELYNERDKITKLRELNNNQ